MYGINVSAPIQIKHLLKGQKIWYNNRPAILLHAVKSPKHKPYRNARYTDQSRTGQLITIGYTTLVTIR